MAEEEYDMFSGVYGRAKREKVTALLAEGLNDDFWCIDMLKERTTDLYHRVHQLERAVQILCPHTELKIEYGDPVATDGWHPHRIICPLCGQFFSCASQSDEGLAELESFLKKKGYRQGIEKTHSWNKK